MAKNKNKPAWAANQQKSTDAKGSEERAAEAVVPGEMVKIKMKTDYRDVAKAGDVWETDGAKAKELVDLGRAEYVK